MKLSALKPCQHCGGAWLQPPKGHWSPVTAARVKAMLALHVCFNCVGARLGELLAASRLKDEVPR